MAKNSLKWLALAGGVALGASTVSFAQDSGALLNLLARKGIITDQEAEELRAELTADFAQTPWAAAGGKGTKSLSISGRLQTQFAGLDTNTANGVDPAAVNHFFLRRVYFGAKAQIGSAWTAELTYDFAGESFDKALVSWDGVMADQPITIGVGLRKVNFGYEETLSSGSLKAIERTGATRYFMEENNGRRLGAGSYRTGVFLDGNVSARKGKSTGFYYGAAITNPERVGTALANPGFAGDATTNKPAYWADAGYSGKVSDGSFVAGIGYGFLPDQAGAGRDISEFSVYFDGTFGIVNVAAEYLSANVEGLGAAARDADVSGFWIQPSVMLGEKLELVARYSETDTDGRGIRVSDGIRSSASIGGAGTGTDLKEYYAGVNYYLVGNDLKLQLGYVGGKTGGATRNEEVSGLRSQLQVNF